MSVLTQHSCRTASLLPTSLTPSAALTVTHKVSLKELQAWRPTLPCPDFFVEPIRCKRQRGVGAHVELELLLQDRETAERCSIAAEEEAVRRSLHAVRPHYSRSMSTDKGLWDRIVGSAVLLASARERRETAPHLHLRRRRTDNVLENRCSAVAAPFISNMVGNMTVDPTTSGCTENVEDQDEGENEGNILDECTSSSGEDEMERDEGQEATQFNGTSEGSSDDCGDTGTGLQNPLQCTATSTFSSTDDDDGGIVVLGCHLAMIEREEESSRVLITDVEISRRRRYTHDFLNMLSMQQRRDAENRVAELLTKEKSKRREIEKKNANIVAELKKWKDAIEDYQQQEREEAAAHFREERAAQAERTMTLLEQLQVEETREREKTTGTQVRTLSPHSHQPDMYPSPNCRDGEGEGEFVPRMQKCDSQIHSNNRVHTHHGVPIAGDIFTDSTPTEVSERSVSSDSHLHEAEEGWDGRRRPFFPSPQSEVAQWGDLMDAMEKEKAAIISKEERIRALQAHAACEYEERVNGLVSLERCEREKTNMEEAGERELLIDLVKLAIARGIRDNQQQRQQEEQLREEKNKKQRLQQTQANAFKERGAIEDMENAERECIVSEFQECEKEVAVSLWQRLEEKVEEERRLASQQGGAQEEEEMEEMATCRKSPEPHGPDAHANVDPLRNNRGDSSRGTVERGSKSTPLRSSRYAMAQQWVIEDEGAARNRVEKDALARLFWLTEAAAREKTQLVEREALNRRRESQRRDQLQRRLTVDIAHIERTEETQRSAVERGESTSAFYLFEEARYAIAAQARRELCLEEEQERNAVAGRDQVCDSGLEKEDVENGLHGSEPKNSERSDERNTTNRTPEAASDEMYNDVVDFFVRAASSPSSSSQSALWSAVQSVCYVDAYLGAHHQPLSEALERQAIEATFYVLRSTLTSNEAEASLCQQRQLMADVHEQEAAQRDSITKQQREEHEFQTRKMRDESAALRNSELKRKQWISDEELRALGQFLESEAADRKHIEQLQRYTSGDMREWHKELGALAEEAMRREARRRQRRGSDAAQLNDRIRQLQLFAEERFDFLYKLEAHEWANLVDLEEMSRNMIHSILTAAWTA